MTLQEIQEWIKTAEYIETDYSEFDESGNHYTREIFKKDGKLYSIEYLNGYIMEHVEYTEDHKIKSKDYRLLEVKVFKVEITRYENVQSSE